MQRNKTVLNTFNSSLKMINEQLNTESYSTSFYKNPVKSVKNSNILNLDNI